MPKLIHSLSMEYYTTLITLFQPQIANCAKVVELIATEMPLTPSRIIHDAEIRLETILRLYYLRHSFESYDAMLIYFLAFLGNSALDRLSRIGEVDALPEVQESLRSTIILCIKGLYSQRSHYNLADLIYRTTKARMQPKEVGLLHRYTSSHDVNDQEASKARHAQAEYPLPIVMINEDPTKARLNYLIAQTDSLSIIDERDS